MSRKPRGGRFTVSQRKKVLSRFGAVDEQAEELIAYLENDYDNDSFRSMTFPLEDESFVSAWENYRKESEREGVFKVLSGALMQLAFPVQAGISRTGAYREATRKGLPPPQGDGAGLPMRDEHRLELFFSSSPAGRLPVLFAYDREDFVSLIRALGFKNEPADVPASMGSLIITGYNNWDRIRLYRANWQREHPREDWPEHFPDFSARKELYQDKFIILSDSPYSAVQAGRMYLPQEQWRATSLKIRTGHEMSHYFCKRVLSSMKNNLLDELLADFVGIRCACGRYRGDWLLRFMGLEEESGFRSGGRVENYTRALSPGASAVVCRLLRQAAMTLEKLDVDVGANAGVDESYKALIALSFFTLDELASEQTADLLQEAYQDIKLAWRTRR